MAIPFRRSPYTLFLAIFLSIPAGGSQAGIMRGTEVPSNNIAPLEAEVLPAPEEAPSAKDREFTLPELPEDLTAADTAGKGFRLKAVRFIGATVFSEKQLQAVVAPWLNRLVNMGHLEEMRLRLTRLYTDNDYINSGAILPDQQIENGTVTFALIEGRLEDIRIEGNERLDPDYLRFRLANEDEVFNTAQLQERFQLLLANPLIDRLEGQLIPGLNPGEAVLELNVERALPWSFRTTLDNGRTSGVGELALGFETTLHNLTGKGDRLDARIDTNPERAADETFSWSLAFRMPLADPRLRLDLGMEKSRNRIVEGPVKTAIISSEFTDLHLGLEGDLIRNNRRRLTLGGTLALRESQTFVDKDDPFPFSLGVEDDGLARTSVLRFMQEFSDRDTGQALAVRSTFNLGVDAFDATVNHDGYPDGRFLTWVGQTRYARVVNDAGGQVSFSGALQLASEALLPQERISLGGMDTIRGFPENFLVTDNGYHLSLEYRHPVDRSIWPREMGNLHALIFVDTGKGWFKGGWDQYKPMTSIGVGLSHRMKRISADLYVADAWQDIPKVPGVDDLQTRGIHFRLSADIF